MLLGYYVALIVVDVVPWIGVFIAPMIKPVLSVGFLAAAWTQERGGKPALRMLLRGFGANLAALLPLGIVFVVGISIALGATALIDGGRLLEMLYGAAPAGDADPTGAARSVQQTLASTHVQLAMLFGALCALPTILALWWAPALVVFQDAPLLAALGASLRAAIANWRAALRYALGVFTLGAVVPTLVTTGIALRRAAAAQRDNRRADRAALSRVFRGDVAHLRLRELSRRVPRRRNAGADRRQRPDRDAALASPSGLRGFEPRVIEREPLDARVAEVDLHARVAAASFGVDDDADAELRVPHALPDAPRGRRRRRARRAGDRCRRLRPARCPTRTIDIERAAPLARRQPLHELARDLVEKRDAML